MTSWTGVALLGAFHGLNPAMGWLFAVALGYQENRSSAVLRALPPIAIGHALAIAPVIALAGAASALVPADVLRLAGVAALLGSAAFLLHRRPRHPRSFGMRVTPRDLVLWSFIMSSAHGSGLMLLPLLLGPGDAEATANLQMLHAHAGAHGEAFAAAAHAGAGVLVLAIHTLAMFAALATAALLAYRILGVGFLRRAWINLDTVWIGALVLAAVALLLG